MKRRSFQTKQILGYIITVGRRDDENYYYYYHHYHYKVVGFLEILFIAVLDTDNDDGGEIFAGINLVLHLRFNVKA